MNEEQIQQKLASTIDDPVSPTEPESPAEPRPEPKEDDVFHDNLPLETTLDKMKLYDYFEIPQAGRHSAEVQTQMSRILDWARDEMKSSEYTDILRAITDQERVMGNRLKDNRLYRLYQYVVINSQRKKLAEQERALYI